MKSMEQQIAEFTESQKADKAEIARLQGVIAKADKTVAASQLATMCKEAELPAPSVTRLTEAFKEAVNTDGMQEAVNTEKKYVQDIKESTGTVTTIRRQNGSSSSVKESDAKIGELKEAQKKAYIASGFDEKTAKEMAGIE